MMIVRHGFMLVGDPFSGKTLCLHVLAEMSNRMNAIEHEQAGNLVEKVKYKTVNPKECVKHVHLKIFINPRKNRKVQFSIFKFT